MSQNHERDKVRFLRLLTVIQGIKMHLKSGGKMRLTRTATPALLRQVAAEFTGKPYARSRKGMEQALADLEAVKASILTPAAPVAVG